jgi:hypothetical protein
VEWFKWYSACLASVRPSSNPSTAKKKYEKNICKYRQHGAKETSENAICNTVATK